MMRPVKVVDRDGDTARVDVQGETGFVYVYTDAGVNCTTLALPPEAARQLGLALIAFSLEAERG